MLPSWTKASCPDWLHVTKHCNLHEIVNVVVHARLYVWHQLLRVFLCVQVLLLLLMSSASGVDLSDTLLLTLSVALLLMLIIKVFVVVLLILPVVYNLLIQVLVWWLSKSWHSLRNIVVSLSCLLLLILLTIIGKYKILARNLLSTCIVVR